MNYSVITKYVDLANNINVTTSINDDIIVFKYDVEPTDEMIQESVNNYLSSTIIIETPATGSN